MINKANNIIQIDTFIPFPIFFAVVVVASCMLFMPVSL